MLRHPQRISIPAWLEPAAWAVALTSQVGLVAVGAPGGPPMTVGFLSRHASAGGLLWNYQLVHPVFAVLGFLGLVHSITGRPLAGRLLVIWLANLALLVVAMERQWGGSSYSAAVLLFPGSWLLVAAGVVFLDERLHLSSTGKTLVHLGLVLLLVHHQWLFHSLFGRLLFG